MVEENTTCEYCMNAEPMHLSPNSDRMLCKTHRMDVTRGQKRCKNFKPYPPGRLNPDEF
jgi:hypothetical protein